MEALNVMKITGSKRPKSNNFAQRKKFNDKKGKE